jgi:Zn-dependent alcohol dehydrogenase
MSPYLFPRAVAIVPKLKLRPLISKVYPLADVVEAFEDQRKAQNIKILVKSS